LETDLVELSSPPAAAPGPEATTAAAAAAPSVQHSKWYRWRHDGKALIDYLLDSEVHTYAFSVAANAILSFIPFCVLLYTLAVRIFHSQAMVHVIDDTVTYFLPTHTTDPGFVTRNILFAALKSSAGGIQLFALIMILISCTGIFLPLEVALNQAWGVRKSRNYIKNQIVAFGLALVMVALGLSSIVVNMGFREFAADVFFQHIDNAFYRGVTYGWMAVSTGVASILFFFFVYWLLPNRSVPWRPVLRTSIVTGSAWLLAKLVFIAVLPHLDLENLYGPFFVSVGLIFWAYVSGLILFAGAQFSVALLGNGKK
jgi:YihY family inner membrane protein